MDNRFHKEEPPNTESIDHALENFDISNSATKRGNLQHRGVCLEKKQHKLSIRIDLPRTQIEYGKRLQLNNTTESLCYASSSSPFDKSITMFDFSKNRISMESQNALHYSLWTYCWRLNNFPAIRVFQTIFGR